MNDSDVQQVSLQTVLKQSAYMLFYVRESQPIRKTASIKKTLESISHTKKNDYMKKQKAVTQNKLSPTPPLSPVTPTVDTPSISQEDVHKTIESSLPSPIVSSKISTQKTGERSEVLRAVKDLQKKGKLEESDLKSGNINVLNATAKWVVEEKGANKFGSDPKLGKALTQWIVREQVIDITPSRGENAREDLTSYLKTLENAPSWDGQRTSTLMSNSRKRASRDDMEYDQGRLSRHQRRKLMKQRAR